MLVYGSPGCNGSPPLICHPNYLCRRAACSCTGDVIFGCSGYAVAYAYEYPFNVVPAGNTCDPNAPPPLQ